MKGEKAAGTTLVPATKTRGLLPKDAQYFSPAVLPTLISAQQELQYLLGRGYPPKSALAFVGSHHQLSSRQLLALIRTTDKPETLLRREAKRLPPEKMEGLPVFIDGFNIIITLEVALSDGMLFLAQDGVIRDLAELRGTYRLIPQTREAIRLLRDGLVFLGVTGATVFLDTPVSNSGNLKAAFYELEWPFPLYVGLEANPDAVLKTKGHVISGDSIILDHCTSWFNAVFWLLGTYHMFPRLSRLVRLNQQGHPGDG